jgi:hypothetical protein
MDPDPNPGGPKTCGSGGSGSATLLERVLNWQVESKHIFWRGAGGRRGEAFGPVDVTPTISRILKRIRPINILSSYLCCNRLGSCKSTICNNENISNL